MSLADLNSTFELLRKVLQVEIRREYSNKATPGGIYRFFQAHFDKHDYDEQTATRAQSVLAYLRRYETAGSIEERASIAAQILRRVDASLAAQGGTEQPPRPRDAVPVAPTTAPPRRDQPPARPVEPPVTQQASRQTAGGSQARRLREDTPGDNSAARPEPPIRAVEPPEASEPLLLDEDDEEEEDRSDFEGENALPDEGDTVTRKPAPAAAQPSAPVAVEAGALDQSAATVLGIRTQEQKRLEVLGIGTLRSLVEYWPRDHYDYSEPVRIARMRPDMQVTLIGMLRSADLRKIPNRNIQIVEAKVSDPTGLMAISWFNQPYLHKALKPRIGEEIAISGKVELKNGRLQLVPRDVEFPADDEDGTNTRRIVPVYPSSEGIAQRWVRSLVRRGVAAGAGLMPDPLPEDLRRRFGLMERRVAIAQYHFPASMEARDTARNRLALDELLLIQLGMLQRKRQWQAEDEGRAIHADPALLEQFRAGLPFQLTGAQDRALGSILLDMERSTPMSRLLQGDVGSGKTVVAAAALLATARAGLQGAIMAPTEILAEQHARTLTAMLEPHGVKVALLTGSLTKAQRARIYLDAVMGNVQVLAGTHALIQEGFTFKALGLAIVDEQHRFGVVQRAALKGKGFNPHLLVMTATPIPRTLTLTIYGDLDVSVIDERPPNRQPVETRWTTADNQAYSLIREQVALGRQAYVVCPLVEESENLEAKAAVAEEKRLQQEVFPDLRLGLLHGKMKPAEKDAVLGRFRDREIDILVATSVVEVGIDVPNATVMVVQDAQRFGLAQLHQFRGRVGRGAEQSYCVLLAEANNPVARERLQALCDTDDGFKLAEEDLRLRGPGEFWGTRQSGLPALQVAQVTDMHTLEVAREVAEVILAGDPQLSQSRHALLAESLRYFWEGAAEPS